MTKKVLFIVFFVIGALISLSSNAQTDVKKNYTKPWFQSNIKIVDTIGVDNLMLFDGGATLTGASTNLTFGGVGTEQHNVSTFNVTATNSFSLISSGSGAVALENTSSGDVTLTSNTGNVTIHNISYPKIDGSDKYVMKTDGSGNISFADVTTLFTAQNFATADLTFTGNRTHSMGANDLLLTGTGMFGLGTASPASKLDIEVAIGVAPFSLYENRAGGANVGDLFTMDFYFNDDIGAKTVANNIITTRIESAVGTGFGNIPNSINIGKDLKVQSNNRVLISPISSTGAAVAQLEVRGQAGVTTNSVFKTKTAGNTASQIAIETENLAGNSLFYVDATAKMFWNTSKQATGDFRMDGGTNANAYYFDAGEEAVVMGGTNPENTSIFEMRSTTKGFLKPKMTEANRDAIASPVSGLEIYNTTTDFPNYYNGTTWEATTTAETVGIEGFFLDPKGAFGVGAGWADEGFIDDFPVLLFNQSATERAIYMFYGLTRAKFDAVDPQVGFVVYSTAAPVVTTGDDVVWELEVRYKADGDALAGAADETIQSTEVLATTTGNTRQTNVFFTLDRTLISDQDVIHLTLKRLGADGSDNYAADSGVGQVGILMQTTNHN